jgi:hypothetical protein
LLGHGLARASFVPDVATQQMRALPRTRKQLAREQASHVQRVPKVLEDANLELSSVVTNILGKSGRAILDALVAVESSADKLLELAGPRLKADRTKIREASNGRVSTHHRFLRKLHLDQIDALSAAIA